jgi:hypothetical protein
MESSPDMDLLEIKENTVRKKRKMLHLLNRKSINEPTFKYSFNSTLNTTKTCT